MNDDYDLTKLGSETKKRTNSKAKGSRFERKIAGMFNDRFKTTEFSRTPGSGAFATTHSLPEHLQIYGDLIAPKNFKYCIECKKGYKNIKINNLLDYSSQLWKFVQQCEKDSEKCNKEPMLLFQQDRQPILAVIRNKWFYCTHNTEGPTKSIQIGDYMMVPFEEILEQWATQDWFNC
jgi:Holliday junction resolvase